MNERSHVLDVSPRGVLTGLLGITGLLLLGHAIVTIAEFGFGHDHVLGLRRLLDFDGEGTAPAWFSSLLFLASAAILGVIWHARRAGGDRFRGHWAVLAAVFLFLALDEAAAVHEQLIDPVRRALDTGGALLHAWIIPYGIALTVMLALYIPFLRGLPARTLRLMLAAGALYVAGAIGMEIVGGYVWDRDPVRGIAIVAIMAVEETLEMVGLALFVYALLDYLARVNPLLGFRIGEHRA